MVDLEPNKHLSIVIPTYNRAEFLNYSLEVHIPLLEKHNIQIFVSDNASTDNTTEIIKKWMDKYSFLYYYKNESNIGADANFEKALKYPTTKYIWLLGDAYKVSEDGIKYLLDVIMHDERSYDLFVFNYSNRVINIKGGDYLECNELLNDLGWHMTCLATLVYSSELIANANFNRYKNTMFIQTGIIFEYLAMNFFRVQWVEHLSIQSIFIKGHIKQSWQQETFKIWIEKWTNFIFSLPPAYNLSVKMKCIRDHGSKSGLFSFRKLLLLRSSNILNYQVYKKNLNYFQYAIALPKLLIFIIAIAPKVALKILGVIAIILFSSDKKNKLKKIL